jgi:putative transposase
VKYEELYLCEYANGHEAQRSLSKYLAVYNGRRLHESLGYATPDEVCCGALTDRVPVVA